MIIGIDAGCLSVTDENLKTGVYYSAKNIVIALGKKDVIHKYYLYSFSPLDATVMNQLPRNFQNIVLPSIGWMKLMLPLSFLFIKPDIFLSLSQSMPRWHPFITIALVHGLDFDPAYHNYKNSLSKLEKETANLAKHAEIVLTTSHFLKRQIESRFHRSGVGVLPLGVANTFSPHGEIYKHKKPYFLFVGSLKPSKNIPGLITAFAMFRKKTALDYDLFLIGSPLWPDSSIAAVIEKHNLQSYIHTLPSLPPERIAAYMRGAIAFVSPALYEGFGLTLVEAMACGMPVITGNHSAEHEVIGDAGILVNPRIASDIANAMCILAESKPLQKNLRNLSIIRAKLFSWDTFVGHLHSIIRSYEH